jgi:tRNA-dihydrouridine synthase A
MIRRAEERGARPAPAARTGGPVHRRHHPRCGREAYHNPWWLASWDALYYGDAAVERTRESVEEQMVAYMEHEARTHGTHWYAIARHMLGLRNGLAGARRWRQVWSNHQFKQLPPSEVMRLARTKPAEAALAA